MALCLRRTAVFQATTNQIGWLAFSPDRERLAVLEGNGLHLWNLLRQEQEKVFPDVANFAFTPDRGRLIITPWGHTSGHQLTEWDTESNQQQVFPLPFKQFVSSFAFSPDLLAVGSHDSTIRFLNPTSYLEVAVMKGNATAVCDITFSPDGRTLASYAMDGGIKLWNVATRRQIISLPEDGSAVATGVQWRLARFFTDQILAVASSGGSLAFWRVPSALEIETTERARQTQARAARQRLDALKRHETKQKRAERADQASH